MAQRIMHKILYVAKTSSGMEYYIVSVLSEIATCQLHAAYCVLTHGLASKWLFLRWSIPNIHHFLEPLETTVRTTLTSVFVDTAHPNECLCNLFALPVRSGGLGILSRTIQSLEFENSLKVCAPLIKLVMEQNNSYSYEILSKEMSVRSTIHCDRYSEATDHATTVRAQLPTNLQYAFDLVQRKEPLSWPTALLLQEHKLTLHNDTFQNAFDLCYGWQPTHTPTNCSCDTSFSLVHELSCLRGDSPSFDIME